MQPRVAYELVRQHCERCAMGDVCPGDAVTWAGDIWLIVSVEHDARGSRLLMLLPSHDGHMSVEFVTTRASYVEKLFKGVR